MFVYLLPNILTHRKPISKSLDPLWTPWLHRLNKATFGDFLPKTTEAHILRVTLYLFT